MIGQTLLKKLPKSCDTIFSTDLYKKISTKIQECQEEDMEKLSKDRKEKKQQTTRKNCSPNDKSKLTFVRLLEKNWSDDSSAQGLPNRKVVIVCELETPEIAQAICLTSHDETITTIEVIKALESIQEETDTRVVLHSLFARQKRYKSVRVQSPESDVFFILLYYTYLLNNITVMVDTGAGNHMRLINIAETAKCYYHEYIVALLALHASVAVIQQVPSKERDILDPSNF